MKKLVKKAYYAITPWLNRTEKINILHRKAYNALIRKKGRLSNYYSFVIYKKYNCLISSSTIFSSDVKFPHPLGIVIGDGVKIGKNVTIYQNVTIGRKSVEIVEYPTICDNVTIYCNSVILGNIVIGDGATIGAGSIVLRDVKPGEKVYGIVK